MRAPLTAEDAEKLANIGDELEDQLSGLFDREEIEPVARRFDLFVHMKYRLQPGALVVPMIRSQPKGTRQDLRADFEARYTEIYGPNAAFRNSEVEIVKVHVEGTSDTVVPTLAPLSIAENNDPGLRSNAIGWLISSKTPTSYRRLSMTVNCCVLA